MPEPQVTYDFGVPPEKGVLLGLSLAQAAPLLGGVLLSAFMLSRHAPVPIAVLPGACGVAVGFLRIRSERVLAWVPILATHLMLGREWSAPLPSGRLDLGPRAAGKTSKHPRRADRRATRRLPSELGLTRLVSEGATGLVAEERARRQVLTMVLRVRGRSAFLLLPRDEQVRQLASWGGLLAELAGAAESYEALSWVERQVPDLSDEARAWMEIHAKGPAGRVEDYRAVVEAIDSVSSTHEVYLAATMAPRERSARAGLERAAFEAGVLKSRLDQVGLDAEVLSDEEIAGVLRASLQGVAYEQVGPANPEQIAPMAIRRGWDQARIDGLTHRTWAVSAWPRIPVGATFLEPLLTARAPGAHRTIAVHLSPMSVYEATRNAQAAMTATAVTEASRARYGFVQKAVTRRERAEAERREAEVVAGHATYRVAALVSVAAPDATTLEAASRQVRHGAAASLLDLRLLYGRQADAYFATLPLGHAAIRKGLLS